MQRTIYYGNAWQDVANSEQERFSGINLNLWLEKCEDFPQKQREKREFYNERKHEQGIEMREAECVEQSGQNGGCRGQEDMLVKM